MRKSKVIKIDDREVTIKELTVRQVDECIESLRPERKPLAIELLLDPVIPAEIVVMSTDFSMDQLAGDMSPSELKEIWDAVAEVNDFLSAMLARMAAAGGIHSAETG